MSFSPTDWTPAKGGLKTSVDARPSLRGSASPGTGPWVPSNLAGNKLTHR